jgi:hypothetical protein
VLCSGPSRVGGMFPHESEGAGGRLMPGVQAGRGDVALPLLTRRSECSRRVTLGEPDLIYFEPAGRRLTAARLFDSPTCSQVCAGWGDRAVPQVPLRRAASDPPAAHLQPLRLSDSLPQRRAERPLGSRSMGPPTRARRRRCVLSPTCLVPGAPAGVYSGAKDPLREHAEPGHRLPRGSSAIVV